MKLDIYKQKWIDMVFEGRNKAYGAYVLRKENPKMTLLALLIGSTVFAGLLALPMINWSSDEDADQEKVTMVDMAKLNIPPPVEEIKPLVPPPPPPPPAPKVDEVKFVKPKVVEKEKVVEEIKTIEELKDKNVGTKDVKGRDDGKIVIDAPSGEGDKDVKIVEDNTIYNAVEVRPEYPGGIGKFLEFVGKNYRAPEEDIKGKVIVQFVVEKDGSLTDIKVMRDLGYGTGAEAIRVLKKSPRWKPGIQNGRPVRVLYSLPISIVGG
ncbi:energy transducer TonB [Flavobacterium antarcticum]|uniref:energy transducer TonB n=1 Tax=Flavobacterium antarcticum TaxID=271155 RepID=UPI0003B2E804|nr:energy transducer TonB [Flavobacterium antarcticum]